jgi:phosphate uptake regulator
METRKVQITGKSTYIISLPKNWVNVVKIKNGDSCILIPRSDGTLLINPKLNENKDVTTNTIHVESRDMETLFRKFIGSYLAGFNVIDVSSPDKLSSDIREHIRTMTTSVIGPAIIDETMTSVKIMDLLDSSDLSLMQSLKRMYLITRGMHRDAIVSLQTQDSEFAKDVESRDNEVDKFYWLIAKQYNIIMNDLFFADKMGVKPQEVLGYLLVARSIERIADHAKKLASNAKNIKANIEIISKISDTSEQIMKEFDQAINAFNRNKFDYANDVVNKTRSLGELTKNLTQEIFTLKDSAMTIVSLAYIVDSLERTRAYVLDIAEIAINHQYVKAFLNEKP